MKIRRAILLAANRIAKHPALFRFFAIPVPLDCKTPGCALGWIRFYHKSRSQDCGNIAPKALKVRDREFYGRMNALESSGGGWSINALECAAALRLYADKYHPLKGAKA